MSAEQLVQLLGAELKNLADNTVLSSYFNPFLSKNHNKSITRLVIKATLSCSITIR